jgi:hypothetical protein
VSLTAKVKQMKICFIVIKVDFCFVKLFLNLGLNLKKVNINKPSNNSKTLLNKSHNFL